MISVDRKDVFFILFQLLASVAVGLSFDGVSTQILAFIIVVDFAVGLLYFLYIKQYPYYHFLIIFWIVSFVYYTSSAILYIFYGELAMVLWRFSDFSNYNYGLFLINSAFCASFVAACLKLKVRLTIPNLKPSEEGMYVVGKGLFAVSCLIIAYFSFTGKGLNLLLQDGYTVFSDARKAGELSTWFISALNMFLPWSLLILASYILANQRVKNINFYIFILVPGLLIMFLSGDRTAPLTVLMMVFIMAKSNKAVEKRKKLRIFSLGNIAFFISIIMLATIVKNLRRVGASVSTENINFVSDSEFVNGNPVLDLAYNTSTSMQTLVGTTMIVPGQEDYRYGFDYLKSVIFAIPFAAGFLQEQGIDFRTRRAGIMPQPTQWISYHYNRGRTTGLGFLLISEAYLQFGLMGVVLVHFLLVLLIKRLFQQFSEYSSLNQRVWVGIIMIALFVWIRNDSGGIMKTILWSWLFIFPLSALVGMVFSVFRLRLFPSRS